MKLGDPTFAGLAARLRAGTVTPADLDAAADALGDGSFYQEKDIDAMQDRIRALEAQLAAIDVVPVADVWRWAIEAAAQAAGIGTFPITGRYDDLTPAAQARANECARIQNAIRALPMPADLGGGND